MPISYCLAKSNIRFLVPVGDASVFRVIIFTPAASILSVISEFSSSFPLILEKIMSR